MRCARDPAAHANELNIDPMRIGAYGVSAGAHLAMMLGALDSADAMEGDGGNLEQPSKVQAVVSYVGPVNLAGENYTQTQVQILTAFLGGDPREKQAECRLASPITYLDKGDAPVLCFFGTKDPLVSYDQALQIATALTNSGVPGRVEMILGAGHGWRGKEQIRTHNATMAFFDEHLMK